MNAWNYFVLDIDSNTLLLTESGFETEADAEEQARMEATVLNIKNYKIVTEQKWIDI